MRRTLTACRSGLSVVAAVVLLTACGGSGNNTSASSNSSSSASETSAAAADSKFCQQAAGIENKVSSSLNQSDPASLGQALKDAADEIRAIEPPAEIASDWTAFADGIEQIAATAQVDVNDPDALASFQQQYGSAFTNVENYLRNTCGIHPGSSESASPTS
jgi:hypothetical protein